MSFMLTRNMSILIDWRRNQELKVRDRQNEYKYMQQCVRAGKCTTYSRLHTSHFGLESQRASGAWGKQIALTHLWQ